MTKVMVELTVSVGIPQLLLAVDMVNHSLV